MTSKPKFARPLEKSSLAWLGKVMGYCFHRLFEISGEVKILDILSPNIIS
jgi:hypothetical protein